MPERQGIVEITLDDGRVLSHHTLAVRGTPRNPMGRSELQQKCLDLISPVTGTEQAEALCAAVWKLETIQDVRALRSLLYVA
jgi:2-methylcitrate dehydratase PrpD